MGNIGNGEVNFKMLNLMKERTKTATKYGTPKLRKLIRMRMRILKTKNLKHKDTNTKKELHTHTSHADIVRHIIIYTLYIRMCSCTSKKERKKDHKTVMKYTQIFSQPDHSHITQVHTTE